jgi:hypothetical protein
MSIDTVFKPLGPTVLVGVTAVQVVASGTGSNYSSIRVRNTATTTQYFTWGGAAVAALGAPTAGVPSANTIGMAAGATETFDIPPALFFIGNTASAFEMTPGQGAS